MGIHCRYLINLFIYIQQSIMIQVKKASLGGLLFFLAFSSCMKNSNHSGNGAQLNLSSTSLRRGEPLLISTDLSDNSTIIRWTVHPSNGTTIMPAKNHAVALFGFSGKYGITASYYAASDTTKAYDSSAAQIVVNDSIYTSPSPDNLDSVSLAGDEITLVPVSATDSGLVIMAKTKRLYNCAAYLTAYSWTPYGPGVDIDFNGAEVVEGKGDCQGAQNPAISYLLFGAFSPGNYNINAHLNGVDYQGTLTVTNTSYQFNWNYSSGVIISPVTLMIDGR
jgi:hypothetical protein